MESSTMLSGQTLSNSRIEPSSALAVTQRVNSEKSNLIFRATTSRTCCTDDSVGTQKTDRRRPAGSQGPSKSNLTETKRSLRAGVIEDILRRSSFEARRGVKGAPGEAAVVDSLVRVKSPNGGAACTDCLNLVICGWDVILACKLETHSHCLFARLCRV